MAVEWVVGVLEDWLDGFDEFEICFDLYTVVGGCYFLVDGWLGSGSRALEVVGGKKAEENGGDGDDGDEDVF
ncbi:hypothetical protein HGA64_01415 [Candidatus Falkowbacteria bacterium]|nr:hypothetical protein [Candidatus Falkowbacteria bacterium]